jgi:N-methylhydantoinase A
MKYRIGVDVGGTFTDFYLKSETDDEVHTLKIPSTPNDPSRAIVEGVTSLLKRHNVQPVDVTYLCHGTTVATNAILQQRGSRVGLVTTAGFRDLLEIARQKRPSVYDLFADKPPVLVPRHLRREIVERAAYDGTVVREMDLRSVEEVLTDLIASEIDALAICFLHSYANPEHESKVKTMAHKKCPELYVTASHELTGEFREYERFMTAVLNAYVGPTLNDYFLHLESSLEELGLPVAPHIIQSNGGLMSISSAASAPIRTALSGPSAGVVGAGYVARLAASPDIITLDMGGTSTDVSLLQAGRPSMQGGQQVGGYPIRVPAIAIHTIGAGGGSIAWLDQAFGFHVGPKSAGAVPGPAAYGLGGQEPTVTDANVILGRLNQQALLGGEMPVYRDLAARSMQPLADSLRMPLEQVAAGVVRIVVSNMVRAVRVISVEKGEDPRNFALMAFGGAGPLHAVDVARQLEIRKVVIPPAPGLLCALGALVAVPTMEYSRSKLLSVPGDVGVVCEVLAELEVQARKWLIAESIPRGTWQLHHSVDMRYQGQNHELTVSLPGGGLDDSTLVELADSFHREHERQFSYCSPDVAVQIVSCRVVAAGAATEFSIRPETSSCRVVSPVDTRDVFFDGPEGWRRCSVYWRPDLHRGGIIEGPAIIEQLDSTTVLSPGDTAEVDSFGNIVITVGLSPGEVQPL